MVDLNHIQFKDSPACPDGSRPYDRQVTGTLTIKSVMPYQAFGDKEVQQISRLAGNQVKRMISGHLYGEIRALLPELYTSANVGARSFAEAEKVQSIYSKLMDLTSVK